MFYILILTTGLLRQNKQALYGGLHIFSIISYLLNSSFFLCYILILTTGNETSIAFILLKNSCFYLYWHCLAQIFFYATKWLHM